MTREEMLKLIIYGCPYPMDILYSLTKGDQKEYVTIYNDEITGYSEGLKEILRYGGSAYFWLASPSEFAELGWSGEIIR